MEKVFLYTSNQELKVSCTWPTQTTILFYYGNLVCALLHNKQIKIYLSAQIHYTSQTIKSFALHLRHYEQQMHYIAYSHESVSDQVSVPQLFSTYARGT